MTEPELTRIQRALQELRRIISDMSARGQPVPLALEEQVHTIESLIDELSTDADRKRIN